MLTSKHDMKHLLLTTIAAVLLVGCGEAQPSTPLPEAKPVETVAAATEPTTAKPEHPQANRAMIEATATGNVKAIKKAIANGADVNVKAVGGGTLLFIAAHEGHREVAELLIAEGADVNETNGSGETPLNWAKKETADLLRTHGGKTGEELKAEGK
jgi:multidrug efflux pump subunit AcrA (membrane-fusion protein)